MQSSVAFWKRLITRWYACLMKVRDHAPQHWFLFEEAGTLYLDVNCSHSAFGYTFMVELNAEEAARYRVEGRAFLDWLAGRIQDTAPNLSVSTSPYKGRDVSGVYAEQTAHA